MNKSSSDLFHILKNRSYFRSSHKSAPAFTIVELLVVIVVIGILAAISIVSYSGVTQRATVVSLQSDLANASQQLKLFQIDNNAYPTTINCALPDSATNKCLRISSGNTLSYSSNNTVNPQTFCVVETKGTQSYTINHDGTLVTGDCLGYGLALNLDAGNSVSYSGSGTTWTDLSGSHNCNLLNGVGYTSSNGGALNFDGINDYADCGNITSLQLGSTSFTISMWIEEIASGHSYPIFLYAGASGTTKGFYLREFLSTKTLGYILNDGVNKPDQENINSINPNQWVMFSVVIDRLAGVVYPYINGVLQSSRTWNISTLGDITPSSNLLVGSDNGSSYPLNGLISTVKIYSRALGADEILQSFNSLRGRYGI
jgi:prepilin-type N-terminal cleavage/methylation domain-containing protein